MKRIVFCAVVCLSCSELFAQPPDTLWTRTFGGDAMDVAANVLQTAEGDYVIAGSSRSYGSGDDDLLLMKINSLGDAIWTRICCGTEVEVTGDFQQTADGGYIIAGWIGSYFGNERDIYVVKTDSLGDTLWTRRYGGSGLQSGASIQQTFDGGYVLAGYTIPSGSELPDFYLVKTDDQGDTLWTRAYGGSGYDDAYAVQQTTDSGFIIAGDTYSAGAGGQNVYLVKTDAAGDTLWTRVYGGVTDDWASSLQLTAEGGFVMAGGTNSFGAGSVDFYVVKVNALGDVQWTRTYGGSADDVAYSIQQTSDGGYVIAGYTMSYHDDNGDVYVVRTNSGGDTLWTRIYDRSVFDVASCIRQTLDGGYVIAGEVLSSGLGNNDIYVIKTGPDSVDAISGRQSGVPQSFSLSAYPNPFNPTTQIELNLPRASKAVVSVYNLLGRHIATLHDGVLEPGEHRFTFDASGLPSGLYFARMQSGDFTATQKLLLLK